MVAGGSPGGRAFGAGGADGHAAADVLGREDGGGGVHGVRGDQAQQPRDGFHVHQHRHGRGRHRAGGVRRDGGAAEFGAYRVGRRAQRRRRADEDDRHGLDGGAARGRGDQHARAGRERDEQPEQRVGARGGDGEEHQLHGDARGQAACDRGSDDLLSATAAVHEPAADAGPVGERRRRRDARRGPGGAGGGGGAGGRGGGARRGERGRTGGRRGARCAATDLQRRAGGAARGGAADGDQGQQHRDGGDLHEPRGGGGGPRARGVRRDGGAA